MLRTAGLEELPEEHFPNGLLLADQLKVQEDSCTRRAALLGFGKIEATPPFLHLLLVQTLCFQIGCVGHQVVKSTKVTHGCGKMKGHLCHAAGNSKEAGCGETAV